MSAAVPRAAMRMLVERQQQVLLLPSFTRYLRYNTAHKHMWPRKLLTRLSISTGAAGSLPAGDGRSCRRPLSAGTCRPCGAANTCGAYLAAGGALRSCKSWPVSCCYRYAATQFRTGNITASVAQEFHGIIGNTRQLLVSQLYADVDRVLRLLHLPAAVPKAAIRALVKRQQQVQLLLSFTRYLTCMYCA